MNQHWYVLRSKSCKEEALYREACARGLEVFYPQIRVHPVNPRARKLQPFFPGYMFVHADLEQVGHSRLAWMPFSIGLVSFGGEPARVPEGLVSALRNRLTQANAGRATCPTGGMQPGQAVRIPEGPFAGYQAVFDCYLAGHQRVRVLLKLLHRQQMPLELPAEEVQPMKQM